jgi:hypothetical protein
MSDRGASDEPKNGLEVYADFVRAELAEERARRGRLEQRGLAIITTSGALTTLLLAVAVLAVGRDAVTTDRWATFLVGVAALGFAASGALAIQATGLWPYKGLPAETLEKLRDAATEESEDATRRTVAGLERGMMTSLRDMNDGKAAVLRWAFWAQAIALIALFVVLVVLFLSRVL